MRLLAALTLCSMMLVTPAQAIEKRADPNKRVCRYQDLVGSIIPKQECRTRAQWDAIDEANHDKGAAALDASKKPSPFPMVSHTNT